MRAEGKEYVVKDGDVLNFLFNVWWESNDGLKANTHEKGLKSEPFLLLITETEWNEAKTGEISGFLTFYCF
jgi:hypothetical protein